MFQTEYLWKRGIAVGKWRAFLPHLILLRLGLPSAEQPVAPLPYRGKHQPVAYEPCEFLVFLSYRELARLLELLILHAHHPRQRVSYHIKRYALAEIFAAFIVVELGEVGLVVTPFPRCPHQGFAVYPARQLRQLHAHLHHVHILGGKSLSCRLKCFFTF